MPIVNQECLSFDEIKALLPSKYSNLSKIRRNVYSTDGGTLPIYCAKEGKQSCFWFSCPIELLADDYKSDVIVFVLGYYGIAVIPIDIMLEYSEGAYYRDYSYGASYYVRFIKRGDNRFELIHYEGFRRMIDKYFIPA